MKQHLMSEHSDLKGHSVLIIDDDLATLRAMSDYLEHIELEALVARDGTSGIEKARYARPDLILLDVRLPGADGFDICESLKADEATKDIPVIFMTALTQTEHKIKGFKAGAVDYITKPLQFEEVLARVATHLQLRDLHQRLEQKVSDRTAQLAATNQKLREEIADHQRTAAALKKAKARYRCLFEDSPISLREEDFSKVQQYFKKLRESGIVDFRTHFGTYPEAVTHCAKLVRVVHINKATLELYGSDSKEKLMGDLTDMFTNASLEVFRKELITLARGELKFQSEATLLNMAGEQIHVILCLRVAPGSEASLKKVMISLLDITERKRAEQELVQKKAYLEKQALELRQAKKEAEAADRAKGRFLYKISHELRSPLNPILGYAQLLKRQANLTKKQRRQLNDIHTSGQNLLALIDDILNYCQKNDNTVKVTATEFNLPKMIEDIKTEWSAKAADKGLSFAYEAPVALPERVVGHEENLIQVLRRLLNNAIKFTTQDGITLRVLCTDALAAKAGEPVQTDVCRILFQVEDTGMGIAKEKLDSIFQMFTQAPEEGQLASGMGLGLSICRQLVAKMGGTIYVESKVGHGSVFTVAMDFNR